MAEYSSPGLSITSETDGVMALGIDICSDVAVKQPDTLTVCPLLGSFSVRLTGISTSASVLMAAVVILRPEPEHW